MGNIQKVEPNNNYLDFSRNQSNTRNMRVWAKTRGLQVKDPELLFAWFSAERRRLWTTVGLIIFLAIVLGIIIVWYGNMMFNLGVIKGIAAAAANHVA